MSLAVCVTEETPDLKPTWNAFTVTVSLPKNILRDLEANIRLIRIHIVGIFRDISLNLAKDYLKSQKFRLI